MEEGLCDDRACWRIDPEDAPAILRAQLSIVVTTQRATVATTNTTPRINMVSSLLCYALFLQRNIRADGGFLNKLKGLFGGAKYVDRRGRRRALGSRLFRL
jgi:hypothetical protein